MIDPVNQPGGLTENINWAGPINVCPFCERMVSENDLPVVRVGSTSSTLFIHSQCVKLAGDRLLYLSRAFLAPPAPAPALEKAEPAPAVAEQSDLL